MIETGDKIQESLCIGKDRTHILLSIEGREELKV